MRADASWTEDTRLPINISTVRACWLEIRQATRQEIKGNANNISENGFPDCL